MLLLQGFGWAGWEPEDTCLQRLLNPCSPEGSRCWGEKGSRSRWLLLKLMEKEGSKDQLETCSQPSQSLWIWPGPSPLFC